jgi:hypothetical protein
MNFKNAGTPMTITLIDNATVSSVQRALGKAQLNDSAILDIEHASLERFVEAVLFSTTVVVPDNYKAQFTPPRKELLTRFNVQFLPVDEPTETSLSSVAKGLAGVWSEAFTEGRANSLFDHYFAQVEAFSKFIWEFSSSEFFLVFRAHGVDKANPLISALLSSPKDEELGQAMRIVAQDGHRVDWNRLAPHVRRMLGVMGWLGHQYVWHQALAAQNDFVYSPHPLREFFANDFLNRLSTAGDSAVHFSDAFREGIVRFRGKVSEGLNRLGALESSANVQFPALLPLIVQDSNNADDFISVLAEMRTDPKVVELRELLARIQEETSRGQYGRRRQFLAEMEKVGDALLIERGIDQRLLRVKPPTEIIGISIEGDDTGIALPIPSVLYRQYFFRRTYRAFMRDVMAELAAPSKYGAIRTKLGGWAWLNESLEYAGNPFYLKPYHFPSKFHRPLKRHREG